MPVLPPEDWARIRLEYEADTRPVKEICNEFGITTPALYQRMRKEFWRPRKVVKATVVTGRPATRRNALVDRLCSLFAQQLDIIEAQGTGTDRLANLERDCQALEALARTFDRIVQAEMRAEAAFSMPKPVTRGRELGARFNHQDRSHDATRKGAFEQSETELAQRRAALAERLFGLHEQGSDPATSGGIDGS